MKNNKQKAVAVLIVVLAFVFVCVLEYSVAVNNAQRYQQEVPQVQEVDERDNIQKLSDNFAQSYRELVQAEQEHAVALEKLDKAMERYNESADYLQTYTK